MFRGPKLLHNTHLQSKAKDLHHFFYLFNKSKNRILLLAPKEPCLFRGQMGFWAGTYGCNFCHDFFNLLLKIEKLIIFVGIYIFFQSVPGNKSYAQSNSKQRRGGNKKKIEFKKRIEFFLPHRLYIFLHGNLWFIPFGFVMRKLWTILFIRWDLAFWRAVGLPA